MGVNALMVAFDLGQLARVRRTTQGHEPARHIYLQMLSCHPYDPLPAYNIGNLDYQAGNLDSAAQWYETSIAAAPRYPPAYFGLALVELDRGNRERAIANLEASLSASQSGSEISSRALKLLAYLEEMNGAE